jgi:hypothetical protein
MRRAAMMIAVVSGLWFAVPRQAAGVSTPDPNRAKAQQTRFNEDWLREKGYDPNDNESIRKAAGDAQRPSVRSAAVELLAARIGQAAAPVVKQAVADSDQSVRCSAAKVLAAWGDETGLVRMRKDLAEQTPKRTAAEIDLAADVNQPPKEEAKRLRTLRLTDALAAGKVLVEFSDRSAYDLAVRVLEGSEILACRYAAMQILTEIGKADPAVLRSENRDPDAVILGLAANEREVVMIGAMRQYAHEHRRPEVGIRILEAMAKSSHLSDDQRKGVELSLTYLKLNLEKAQIAGPQAGKER